MFKTVGSLTANIKLLFTSVLTATLPTTADVNPSISASVLTILTDEKEIAGIWSEGILPNAFKLATPFATPDLFASNFKLILLDKLIVSAFCNK